MTTSGAAESGRSAAALATASKRANRVLLIAIPLIAGLWLASWMSENQFRAVMTPESAGYMRSAEGSGSAGERNSAPLYSALLGAGTMLGARAERFALAINCCALGMSLLFAGLIARRLSGSVAAGIAAQAIMAVIWGFLRWHLYAHPAPLSLALTSGGIWLLAEYQRRQRVMWLVFASALFSLAALCGYAALGAVAGATAYLIWRPSRRLRDALMPAVPFAVWAVVQLAGRGKIEFAAPSIGVLTAGFRSLGYFIAPAANALVESVLGMAALALLVVAAACRRTRLLGCVGCGCVVFLFASRAVVRGGDPLDARDMMPAALTLLIVLMTMLVEAVRAAPGWRYQASVVSVAVVFLAGYGSARAAQMGTELAGYAVWGEEFASSNWMNSALLARVAQLPPDVVIACGNARGLHALTGRTCLDVPATADFPDDPRMGRIVQERRWRRMAFVEMPLLDGWQGLARERQMRRWFGLDLVRCVSDGTIYRVVERPNEIAEQDAAAESNP